MNNVYEYFGSRFEKLTDTEEKIRFMIQFAMNYGDFMPQFCLEIADRIDTVAKGHPKEPVANGYAKLCRSFCYSNQGLYAIAQTELEEASASLIKLNDYDGILLSLAFRGFAAVSRGQHDLALQLGFEALKTVNECDQEINYYGRVWLMYSMGVFYFNLGDFDTSIQYYRQGLDIALNNEDKYAEARCLSGIGTCLSAQGNYQEASGHIFRSIPLFEACFQTMGLSRALNDLGVVERALGNIKSADNYLSRSLDLRRSLNYFPGLSTTLLELGLLRLTEKKPDEAIPLLTEALAISEKAAASPKMAQAHHLLADAYRALNDPSKALEHFEKFYEIQNKISGAAAANRLKAIETKFATEKAERETEIHRLRNVELRSAYEMIETKNREILDSITYAQRLQNAILPPPKRFSELLPEAFVLYQPRDIVSGDFYWLETLGGKILFAAVDCTGHGVPGAFVSIVGANCLNRCVHEFGFSDPGQILTKLSELVSETFSRSGEQVNDGMDIALCCFDPQNNTLSYAGAMNDLIIVRNGEISEIKAHKFPIGNQLGLSAYESQTLKLMENDQLYIFTDGYADQFGGEKGKKFKKKNFIQKLASVAAYSPSEQKEDLLRTFTSWRGHHEQLDDVLVIGVKF